MMTRHFLLTAVAGTALTLAGCGRDAETAAPANDISQSNAMPGETTTTAPAATPATTPDQAFANAAAASDTFEIETSRLAASNAQSAAVKSFAATMMTAHSESTAKLKTAASGASPAIVPDPTLSPEQQSMLDGLRAAKGADFDRMYVDAQRTAHQRTLDTLRAYSASGGVPTLKAFATEMVPKVAAHLNMANGLKP